MLLCWQSQFQLQGAQDRRVSCQRNVRDFSNCRNFLQYFQERFRRERETRLSVFRGDGTSKAILVEAIMLRASTRGQAGSPWRPLPLQMRRA